jgi:hypothetical protein
MERRVNAGDSHDLYSAPANRTFGHSTSPSSKWWDGSSSGLEITDVSASGPVMTVSTRSTWQNNRTVVRTHAKNQSQMAWAILNGTGWLRVRPNAKDGVTNVFAILCEALANGRKVDVLIADGQITQATLR